MNAPPGRRRAAAEPAMLPSATKYFKYWRSAAGLGLHDVRLASRGRSRHGRRIAKYLNAVDPDLSKIQGAEGEAACCRTGGPTRR